MIFNPRRILNILSLALAMPFLLLVAACTSGSYRTLRVDGQFPPNSTGARDDLLVSNSKAGFRCASELLYLGIMLELGEDSDINDAPLVMIKGSDLRDTLYLPLLPQGRRKSILNSDVTNPRVTVFSFLGPVPLQISKNSSINIEIIRSEISNTRPIFYAITGHYTEYKPWAIALPGNLCP